MISEINNPFFEIKINPSTGSRDKLKIILSNFFNSLLHDKYFENDDNLLLSIFQSIHSIIHGFLHPIIPIEFDSTELQYLINKSNDIVSTIIVSKYKFYIVDASKFKFTHYKDVDDICLIDGKIIHNDNVHRIIYYLSFFVFSEFVDLLQEFSSKLIPIEEIILNEVNFKRYGEIYLSIDPSTINFNQILFSDDGFALSRLSNAEVHRLFVINAFKFISPLIEVVENSVIDQLIDSLIFKQQIGNIEFLEKELEKREKEIEERENKFDEECEQYEIEATKWKAQQESRFLQKDREIQYCRKLISIYNRELMICNDYNVLK